MASRQRKITKRTRRPSGTKKKPSAHKGRVRPRTRIAAASPPPPGSLWQEILASALPTGKAGEASGGVRLNLYMARCGVASRRGADRLIVDGRVIVNGREVSELGVRVDPLRDRIVVDERVLTPEKPVYVLLNKPAGVVCTSSDREQKPRAIDLVSRVRARVFPVGRLDVESEGLLLLTNDGHLADRLTHPRYGVPKTYHVTLNGRIGSDKLEKLRGGVWLAEGKTQGFSIRVKRRGRDRSSVEVTTAEGRNREIRRVFAKLGHPVVRLKRVRIGNLTLRGIGSGKFRFLTRKEVMGLLGRSSPVTRSKPARRSKPAKRSRPVTKPRRGRRRRDA